MIEVMAQVHMTEAEAARDFHAVMARVREGAEVVIDEGHRPVAVIRTPADPVIHGARQCLPERLARSLRRAQAHNPAALQRPLQSRCIHL